MGYAHSSCLQPVSRVVSTTQKKFNEVNDKSIEIEQRMNKSGQQIIFTNICLKVSCLESMETTPQTDTLFKILYPLGYTMEIVHLESE